MFYSLSCLTPGFGSVSSMRLRSHKADSCKAGSNPPVSITVLFTNKDGKRENTVNNATEYTPSLDLTFVECSVSYWNNLSVVKTSKRIDIFISSTRGTGVRYHKATARHGEAITANKVIFNYFTFVWSTITSYKYKLLA